LPFLNILVAFISKKTHINNFKNYKPMNLFDLFYARLIYAYMYIGGQARIYVYIDITPTVILLDKKGVIP